MVYICVYKSFSVQVMDGLLVSHLYGICGLTFNSYLHLKIKVNNGRLQFVTSREVVLGEGAK